MRTENGSGEKDSDGTSGTRKWPEEDGLKPSTNGDSHPMKQTEKLILAHGTVLFGIGVLVAIFNQEYFHKVYSAEDGVLEWITALTLGTIATLLAIRLWTCYHGFNRRQHITLSLLAVLACFGAGEELSWGQRLFDVSVPDFLSSNNAQGEINLHNMLVAGVNINKLMFSKGILIVFLIYLFVVTPLYHRSARLRVLVNDFGVPVPKRYQIAGYVIVIAIVEGLLHLIPISVPRRGELTEFAITLLVALNIAFPLNREVFGASGNEAGWGGVD